MLRLAVPFLRLAKTSEAYLVRTSVNTATNATIRIRRNQADTVYNKVGPRMTQTTTHSTRTLKPWLWVKKHATYNIKYLSWNIQTCSRSGNSSNLHLNDATQNLHATKNLFQECYSLILFNAVVTSQKVAANNMLLNDTKSLLNPLTNTSISKV